MWGATLANLKENLNKIVSDVHEDDDDGDEENHLSDGISNSRNSTSPYDRRISRSLGHGASVSSSPLANGFDSPLVSEVEQYRTEIQRLQESEAQLKALSVNYAALLKEREDQISRFNEENGSLKQGIETNSARDESLKVSTSSPTVLQGSDLSPSGQHKALVKNLSSGHSPYNGTISRHDAVGNGIVGSMQFDGKKIKKGCRHSRVGGNEKELSDLLEEKNRSLAAMQTIHEQEVKLLRVELDNESEKLGNMLISLQEEQKLKKSLQDEMHSLKLRKDRMQSEMKAIQDELNKKLSEMQHLRIELNKKDNAADDEVESLKRVVAALETESSNLKMENDKLKAALDAQKSSPGTSWTSDMSAGGVQLSGNFHKNEEMELSLHHLERDLREACNQRDKALNELNRLKQHLLDKESEESEKMDEDSKMIEELRENNEYQRAQIRQMEKALKQAIASQEEVKMINNNELQKSKEIIDDLNRKLARLTSVIDAKNIELLNLQTALGQYYAEIEAKEHLEKELSSAREESARLSEQLKDAYQQLEIKNREKEETLSKLLQAERMMEEAKARANKLEEDNEKIRRALEQCMTRLNRMSMDSDYSVDRRIVIKLLVTYFQRNHSKEVLDLMVRMLGFSEEDKQRIGVAHHGAGKGVVRGVFGLPGRLVGGILGGSSAEVPASAASDNQSFADMWVDFLLKETEERERRENEAKGNHPQSSSKSEEAASSPTVFNRRVSNASANPYQSLSSSHSSLFQHENSEPEFSTVPLNSSDSNSQFLKYPRF